MASFVTRLRSAGALALMALGATGCGGGRDQEEEGDATVELFSWWASPGESRALQALLDVHRRDHPGVAVVHDTEGVERTVLEQRLDVRMAEGRPPDLFQVHGGVRLMNWVEYNGVEGENKLEPLDEVAASSGWLSTAPASIVETVTHDDHVYAVPVNVHRINCLFYNKQLFADSGLTPPTTLAELYAVSEAFAAQGITPLAVAAKDRSTPAGLMWEHVFIMSAGAQYYEDLFKGRLESPDTAEVRAALEAGLTVMKHMNPDAEELLWVDGVERVGRGEAAMYMDGDWVKAELQARGYALDEDFGMVTVGEDAFVYVTDTFVLPRGARHRGAALDLLATMGSVAGQDAFNPLKGSIPSRTDTDLDLYDPLSRKAMEDARKPGTRFVPARNLVVPRAFFDPVDEAFWEFVKDRNTDKMIWTMEAHYYLIQEHHARP